MGWHSSRNILPTGERVTLLGGCFGSCNGIAEDNGLGIYHIITNLEDCLVGIDGERTGCLNCVSRHRFGQALPTGEGVALLNGIGFGNYRCTELYLDNLVFLAINLIGKGVLVHGVGTLYLYVMGWHSSRNILPTGERVTLLGGCFGSCNGIAEDNGLGIYHIITNLEDCLVGIDGERTGCLNGMCRHRLRQALPTGEGVALPYGIGFGNYRCAESNFDNLVLRTINLIGNGVLVHGVRTQYLYVTSWHRSRNILPTGERVTLLCRSFGSGDSIAEDNSLGIDDFITNLEDCLVRVDRERTGCLNGMCRHRLRQALPTGEGVALPYGIGFGNYHCAESNFDNLVLRAINLIGNGVLVYGVGTIYLYVTGWHRSRNILPTGERVTLLGGCFGSCNGIAEDNGLGIYHIIPNLEDSLIGIDGEVSCHLHIMRRHCRWQTLPTGECMTLLYGICFGSKRSAVEHIRLLIGFPVKGIGKMVL